MLEESLRAALTDPAHPSFYSAFRASLESRIQAALPTGLLHASESAYLRRADHNPRLVDGAYSEADFAAGYGFGAKTISALNYLDGDLSHLNSLLPFTLRPRFSIGSFIFEVANRDDELTVQTDGSFWLAAYGFSCSPKGRKRYFCLYDVRPTATAINRIPINPADYLHLDSLHPCGCPPTWIDRSSGRIFTCTCFDAIVHPNASGIPGYFPTIRSAQLPRLEIMPGLCAICSEHIPPPEAGHPMYYNAFLQRYLPYRDLFFTRMFRGVDLSVDQIPDANRAAENAARKAVGYPRIGEQWASETLLYRLCCKVLSGTEVIHHHKADFLEGLEFDIFIPSMHLAIEYQGVQHFKPISRFGGEAAFTALQRRDAKKRSLAAQHGILLYEWHYEKPISESHVREVIGNNAIRSSGCEANSPS